jgi:hypothetical protein
MMIRHDLSRGCLSAAPIRSEGEFVVAEGPAEYPEKFKIFSHLRAVF